IDVNGYKGYEILYEGRETAPQNASREVKVRTSMQRFRHVVVGTIKRSYEIVFQSDEDRYDENKEGFDKILRTFKILEDEEG
ncbi:hypothetical protein ACFL59_14960, partial [Planctomycetota bacterium]